MKRTFPVERRKNMRPFFAILSRMKYISRWGLMRNTRLETLSEHSFETAVIAHALALMRRRRFGGDISPERAAVLALFHDVTEIITGDLPTPVKYFNPSIREEYARVEQAAQKRLLSFLPEELRSDYEPLLAEGGDEEEELRVLVKAADKLSALIKCLQERQAGNMEFVKAEEAALRSIKAMNLPEAEIFLKEFLPAYRLTLDELDISMETAPQKNR